MEFGGDLTLDNVVRALEEEGTGFIRIVAECGGAELELRFSPESLAGLKALCSRRLAPAAGDVKRFEVFLKPDGPVEAKLAEGGLHITFSDRSRKEALLILIQDLDLALKLKEGLDSFVSFSKSLAALKGEALF